jgi:hypothetical protein
VDDLELLLPDSLDPLLPLDFCDFRLARLLLLEFESEKL